MKNAAPLITDHVTVETLQRLLFSEEKPASLTPVDIAILTYLVLRRSLDHEIIDSEGTLALRLGCERKTIGESIARLKKIEWIEAAHRGVGRSKGLSLRLDKFPAAQPVRAVITQDAKKLALLYYKALKQNDPKRRFTKNWLPRQCPSAQRILTLSGGDLALARARLSFAVNHPKFRLRAQLSLYHALCLWKRITYAHEALTKQKPQTAEEGGKPNDANECSSATTNG